MPLTIRLAEALRAHRRLQGPRVLCHDDGSSIGRKAVHEWMEKAQRRAMLQATGAFHILRHTFGSHLAMQGATPKAIEELAGHQDLGTTQRHMHLSPAHNDAAIRLLGRRPVEDDAGAPFDSAPPAAALRSGRAEMNGRADSVPAGVNGRAKQEASRASAAPPLSWRSQTNGDGLETVVPAEKKPGEDAE